MQTVIISMRMEPDGAGEPCAEAMHARAIAEALHARGHGACLVCPPDAALAAVPVAVPRFCVRQRGLGAFMRLWRWRRKQGPLLILAIGQESLATARMLGRLGKKPERSLVSAFFFAAPEQRAARFLAGQSCCICGSSFIKEDIENLKIRCMPALTVAQPGLNLDAYAYPPKAWRKGDRVVFGMGGSLEPHSGALLLARAMSALWQHEDLPPWELRMFGSGPRFDEIMEEAEKLGVSSRLSILNDQPLGEASRHCHVWLAPGTGRAELPEILWTGFAAGLPVAAAKSPLHDERLPNDRAAVEIEADNPQKMAKIMLRLLRDAKWRTELGREGARLREYVGLEGMAARICAILEEHAPKQPAG